MKKFVRKPRAGMSDTGPVIVTVTGGLPAAAAAPATVNKYVSAEGRPVRVTGGLPDTLPGELWTAEQRKAHDALHYAAVMGTLGTPGKGSTGG